MRSTVLVCAACLGIALAAGCPGDSPGGNENDAATIDASDIEQDAAPPDPCDGVDCGPHGSCVAEEPPRCACDTGYHADGLSCVADNQPPTITNLPDQVVRWVGEDGTFVVTATDPDAGNTLTFSLPDTTGCPMAPTVDGLSGTVSWHCGSEGQCPLTVRVTDDGEPNAFDEAILTLVCTLSTPTITTTPDATATEHQAYLYDVVCDDPSGAAVTLTVGAQDTCGGMVVDNGDGTGQYQVVPTELLGDTDCIVEVTCGNGLASDTQSQTVSVAEHNQAPTLDNLPAQASAHWSTPGTFALLASDGDQPAQTLSYAVNLSSCGFPVVVDASGLVSWTCGQPATCDVDIEVEDDFAPPATDANALQIQCVNVAPTFGSTPAGQAYEGMTYVYAISCVDPDPDSILLTVEPGDTCGGTLTQNGSGAGSYSFTPAAGSAPASCVIDIGCTDGATPITQSGTVAIDVAPPPTLFDQVVLGEWNSCGIQPSGHMVCWGDDIHGQLSGPTWAGVTFLDYGMGREHACGVLTDGSLGCWGEDDWGCGTPPPGTNYEEICVGRDHSCARRTDNTLACWGNNQYGQSTPPAGVTFGQLDCGRNLTCGVVTDGSLNCFGNNSQGQENVPAGNDFIAVAAGNGHACGLRTGGLMECWGYNAQGQTDVPPPADYIAIAAGDWHSCGLHSDGSIDCFGGDDYGQVSDTPTTADFVGVYAGREHNCAIRSDDTTVCWGSDIYGEGGVPGDFDVLNAEVTFHTCAVHTSGAVSCWGDDEHGQATPPALSNALFASAGLDHTCALRSDGGVTCWGDDSLTQVSTTPTSTDFVQVSAGGGHTCGRRTDGTLHCWGDDYQGVISSTPTTADFVDVDLGWGFNCARRDTGAIVCWGYDGYNQITGTPTTTGFTDVSAGGNHACAVDAAGGVQCWGWNHQGQSTAPAGTGFTAVAAGWEHTCGLRTDGSIQCWGNTGAGKCNPPAGNDFVTLAVGAYTSCAVRSDNTYTCWGFMLH